MKIDFTGKNAVVTGAGSGIGKAIALRLAGNGANVWIGEIALKNGLETLREMKKFTKKFGFTQVDVSKKESLNEMFEEAKNAFGEINIVINSAGVFCTEHFIDAKPEDIKKHLDINLMGTIYGCQLGLSAMIEQGKGGKIVNVSSVGGRHGELDFPWYSLGKAGVLNLTQSAAYNGAKHNVTVNAVCPGIIRTPMWDTILDELTEVTGEKNTEQLFDQVLKERTPLGRAQTTDDIAYAVLFLCSSYADNITGQALNVCGGSVMS